MKIHRDSIEDVFEGLKNLVGIMDCIQATDHVGVDVGSDDYFDDVEISISSYAGDGVFTLKMGSGELSGLHEILNGIESSLRFKLSRECGVEIE